MLRCIWRVHAPCIDPRKVRRPQLRHTQRSPDCTWIRQRITERIRPSRIHQRCKLFRVNFSGHRPSSHVIKSGSVEGLRLRAVAFCSPYPLAVPGVMAVVAQCNQIRVVQCEIWTIQHRLHMVHFHRRNGLSIDAQVICAVWVLGQVRIAKLAATPRSPSLIILSCLRVCTRLVQGTVTVCCAWSAAQFARANLGHVRPS